MSGPKFGLITTIFLIDPEIWSYFSWFWSSSFFVFWSSSGFVAAAKSLQSCSTLCDPIDVSPPGFPIPGILQARVLEWGAIAFSAPFCYMSTNHRNADSCCSLRDHHYIITRCRNRPREAIWLKFWDFPGHLQFQLLCDFNKSQQKEIQERMG